jgi:hypothetical protein
MSYIESRIFARAGSRRKHRAARATPEDRHRVRYFPEFATFSLPGRLTGAGLLLHDVGALPPWIESELAAVISTSAYERAARALAAGFEQCDEHRRLTELQKATLMESALSHFQGLDAEITLLLESAKALPSGFEDLHRTVSSFPAGERVSSAFRGG